MTDDQFAAFYRRYNMCCNEHAYSDLRDFVAPGAAINGVERGVDAYIEGQRSVVRAFPDYRWELRHLVVGAPWIAAHLTDTGTHRAAFFGVERGAAQSPSRSSPSTGSTPARSPRCG